MHIDINKNNIRIYNSSHTEINPAALYSVIEHHRLDNEPIWVLFLNSRTGKLAQYYYYLNRNLIVISINHLSKLSAEAQKYECLYLLLHELEHAYQHFLKYDKKLCEYKKPNIPEQYWQYKFSEKEILARGYAENNIDCAIKLYEKSLKEISNPD
jgi:hypothetical protein